MKSVGIDLGYKSIKVVEIDGDLRKFAITKAKTYSLNRVGNEDIEIALLQNLKEINSDFNLSEAIVCTAIGQENLSHRLLDFPFVERTKIMKSLPFEMEDEIPFAVDECVFDGTVVSREMGLTKMLGVLAPKREVEKLIEYFDKAGISPDIIGSESAAIANLYQGHFPYEAPLDEVVMRILIGHSKTHLLFFQERSLIWSRTILWGGKNIAESIAKAFQISPHDAENLMPEKSFLLLTPAGATVDQMRMSDSIDNALKTLVEQIKVTLIEAQGFIKKPITTFKVIGPVSKIPNLCPHLTSRLSIPVNTENILEGFANSYLGADPSQYLTSLGLALDGYKRPKSPAINFRQGELQKKGIGFEKVWQKWGHALQLVIAAYFIYLGYGITREMLAIDLDEKSQVALTDVATKVAGLRGKSATRPNLEKYIGNQRKFIKDAKNFAKIDDINSAMLILDKLSAKLPANNTNPVFDVRKFELKNDFLTLEGVTDNLQSVTKIKAALETFSIPKSLKKLQPTIKKEDNKETFAFSTKVKRNG